MKIPYLLLIGLLLLVPALSHAATVSTLLEWRPEVGDHLFVDVDSNTAYLVHADARYLPFLVATGVRRRVQYLGLDYYAETPLADWVAEDSGTIQPDRVTFGPSGRFYRLYRMYADGKKRTSYGLHSSRDIKKWLEQPNRYKSYGCIVMTEEMLDVIDATVKINGGHLSVTTTYGSQKFLDELAEREAKQSWSF